MVHRIITVSTPIYTPSPGKTFPRLWGGLRRPMMILIGCDQGIYLATAVQHPNCLVVVISVARAAGGIAIGVKSVGDRQGKGRPDGLRLAAGQPEVTGLGDDHWLGDQGFERIAEPVGAPDGDVVVRAVRMGAGRGCHDAVIV